MYYYLAAPFGHGPQLPPYRQDLVDRGHHVTSHWIDRAVAGEDAYISSEDSALEDIQDILDADALILFTGTTEVVRGGMYVEFGAAMATDMDLIVIGPRTNVFTHLKGVKQYDTWEDFLETL